MDVEETINNLQYFVDNWDEFNLKDVDPRVAMQTMIDIVGTYQRDLETTKKEKEAMKNIADDYQKQLNEMSDALEAATADLKRYNVCGTCEYYNCHARGVRCSYSKIIRDSNYAGCGHWTWRGTNVSQ